MFKDGVYQNIS